VLYNSQQRGLIVDRCWLIYELVSDKLLPPDEFHIEYPNFVKGSSLLLTHARMLRNMRL